ncbi:MAG: sugar ABC transporter permease, partial [Clostridiales bacterium]|nr:sugar ABC transporter permease [Clostridiales bacterium]
VISILAIIGSLQNYGLVMATTGGGPGYETYILALHMYRVAFGSYEMGYGSAMGVFICLIIIVLTIIQQRLTGGTVARD